MSENQYLYNGKERQEELGLRYYNYGARFYDPAIGRFMGVDPISDQFPQLSTFNYAENEPFANIDLHGLQAYRSIAGALIGNDDKGAFKTATPVFREQNPVGAFVQDATFAVASLIGANEVDSAITDGNIGAAVAAGAGMMLTGRGNGARVTSGARVNLKSGKVSTKGQFTEKTSLSLDPEGPNFRAGTIQKVDDFTTSVAPNATTLRPGDPTGGPVVSGALGKAAVITVAGAVAAKATSNVGGNNQKVQNITPVQIVPQIDNTATRIPIIHPINN